MNTLYTIIYLVHAWRSLERCVVMCPTGLTATMAKWYNRWINAINTVTKRQRQLDYYHGRLKTQHIPGPLPPSISYLVKKYIWKKYLANAPSPLPIYLAVAMMAIELDQLCRVENSNPAQGV